MIGLVYYIKSEDMSTTEDRTARHTLKLVTKVPSV